MTVGQRAMATVAALLLGNNAGNNPDKQSSVITSNISDNALTQMEVAKVGGVTQGYISQARFVHDNAPDLVAGILSGDTILKHAYENAKTRKREAEKKNSSFATLQARYPDLARKVAEEELTPEGAEAEANVLVISAGPILWFPKNWRRPA